MKKTAKNGLAAKGTLKISSFFTSQSDANVREVYPKNCNKTIPVTRGNIIDCNGESTNTNSIDIKNKEHGPTSSSNDLINTRDGSASSKKRKVKDIETDAPPKKRNVIFERELSPNSHPTTSEYDSSNITPTKNSCKQIIFLKSPEQLLSPTALNEYNSPGKKLERFMDKIKLATPKKILFGDEGSVNRSPTIVGHSLLSEIDNLRGSKQPAVKIIQKKTTPKKIKTNKDEVEAVESTPNKKRTPKKLFDRSPNNLDEFNVEIIKNFVKITPSKCNKIDPDVIFVRSSEKKQSSILKYISPAPSTSSLKAQRQNELTPTKEAPAIPKFETPKSKVRTKLDFSICTGSSSCQKTEAVSSRRLSQVSKASEDKNMNSSDGHILSPRKHTDNDVDQENDFNFTNVDFNFSDEWSEEMIKDESCKLDLTESQHCKVISVRPFRTKTVITLKSTKNGEQAVCNLEGFWMHTPLNVGDTVHALAKKSNENTWIINNDFGILVYEPDLLVSTTSVVNTLWCKRKSVLSERFRGFEPSNQHMLVGTLVHSLLQSVLKNKYKTRQEIEKLARDLIKQRSIILNIYECGVTLEFIEGELMGFVPKILDFINLYVRDAGGKESSNLKHNKDDWTGTIKAIDDIEENIWCPELGIKGKVDVSIKTDLNTMPLELKTGRATVSLEHRGQVMMYIMMMNKLGYNVPSGLLLYLREGILREVPSTQREKRDIIILRNDLTYYLIRKPKIIENDLTKEKKLFPPDLPEPINHSSCARCPYNVICTSYAKYNNEDISSKKTLKNIQDEVFVYLQDSHLNYFMHWISLLALESNSDRDSKDLREIYTRTPEERESNGKCIINLKITNIAEQNNGMVEHTFERSSCDEFANFFASGIMESNYVVVSVTNRPAVAAGFVTYITAKSIAVTLDRNLNKKYSNRIFLIDSYDSSSIQSYNLASLTLLLELTPKAEKLRQIVIDKQKPTFKSSLPKLIGTKGKQILRRLNIVQQRAVLKAIAAKDYFLIKGMPGTGKTATIVALIQLLVELNKSILITSHTHSAVDNVCIRLVSYGVKVLRLGSESRIHRNMKEYSEYSLTKDCTPEQLEAVYNSAQVIAVTCLGSGHPVLSKRTMDICVVDESTQVLQCSVIRPLHAAKTFILIGDQDQLPAVVRSREAVEMGMSESLFERLYTKEASIALNLNYRMNRTITALANLLTYNEELLIGNETVANATLKLPNKEEMQSKQPYWISKALDDSLENSVQFLDTGPIWDLRYSVPWLTHRNINKENDQSESQSCINSYEAAVTVQLIKALLKAGVPSTEIGVIATYRAQVAHISTLLQSDHIDISTVDQFQGKDKNVIIFSCTKSIDTSVPRNKNKLELLEDKRRLTVAITRAKVKLIIIGDLSTLKQYSTFKKIMPFIEEHTIKLLEIENFSWEAVLNINNL